MVNLKEIGVNDILGSSDNEKQAAIGTKSQVLNFIRQNPEGTTAQMVANHVGISGDRARDILKELCLKRDIYDRKLPGIKEILYYPNGKLIHQYLQESKEMGDQIFRLSFHEGRKNARLQIQERKFTLLEGEKVEGSIFVDVDNIWYFVDFLKDMLDRFNTFKVEKKHENKHPFD